MSQGARGTALITGASSGIGLATALYLAGMDYTVIGTSREIDRLVGLRDEAARRGVRIELIEMDVNERDAIEETVPRLVTEYGGIDVLVNNAGYGLWGPSASLAVEELRAQFETNFFAPFRLMRAVLPSMTQRRHGTIVNISSVLGRVSTPFNSAYVASKHALEGMSESMRTELWPLGVRVVVVEPGYIQTDFHKNQVIAEAAESPESPYHSFVQRYRSRHKSYEGIFANEADQVARVVGKAVRAKRPAFRYPVGLDARLGMMGARIMPERLFHALLSRATLGG